MENEVTYEVQVNRQNAIKDGFCYFWVSKFWMNSSLKVRGSELNTGYTIFPRGQCIVKFPIDNEELAPEDLADILEKMVKALNGPFKAFIKIEDEQENMRQEDF